ncbi:MAG: DUF971 domain-containing protein [Longimicrobiales bacterium]
MRQETTPTYVGPTDDAAKLRITWADGHVSEYSPRYLRLQCRCAGCVNETTGRPQLDPRSVPEDVYPLDIRYVGRYAIRMKWSDGHETGIYPFELLRKICPCDECDIEEAAS